MELRISIASTHYWRNLIEDKTKSAFAGTLPTTLTLTGLAFGGAGAIVAFGSIEASIFGKELIGAVVMGSCMGMPLLVAGLVLLDAGQGVGESNREDRADRQREREYARAHRRTDCQLNPR